VQRGVATDLRWTWIFGTILILVVVVVIGFLSGITSALNSIDKALGTTDKTLTDVGGDLDAGDGGHPRHAGILDLAHQRSHQLTYPLSMPTRLGRI